MESSSARRAFAVTSALVLAAAVAVLAAGRGDDAAAARGDDQQRPLRTVWTDRFGGRAGAAPDPAKWVHDVGGHGWGNAELETYTADPANVALDGRGHLAITARHETRTGPDQITRPYTSGRIKTKGRFSVRYGEISARIRIPEGRGLWPTFWMLGNNVYRDGWPESGEIDVMEVFGHQPRRLLGSVAGPGPTGLTRVGDEQVARSSLAHRFHVYSARWTPRHIYFSLDGRPYSWVWRRYFPGRWVFDHRFFLILNLAVGGRAPGAPDEATQFPAKLVVDWVKVRQR